VTQLLQGKRLAITTHVLSDLHASFASCKELVAGVLLHKSVTAWLLIISLDSHTLSGSVLVDELEVDTVFEDVVVDVLDDDEVEVLLVVELGDEVELVLLVEVLLDDVLVVSDELTVDRVEDVTRPSAPKIQPASKAKAYRMPASSAKSNDAMSTVTFGGKFDSSTVKEDETMK